MSDQRIVMVVVPHEFGYAREVVRGIRSFAHTRTHWWLRCGVVPPLVSLKAMCEQPGRGLIGFFANSEQEELIAGYPGVCAVNISSRLSASVLPRALPDNVEAGRRAARHLLERGFRRFAFVGDTRFGYAEGRGSGFAETLAQEGFSCLFGGTNHRERHAWLRRLPKPIGILADTDLRAQQVLDYALESGISVPEELAIMGVDNDEHFCLGEPVALSSVDIRGFDVGYRSAEMLDRMFRGEPVPPTAEIVPCGEVVVRGSTDTVAVADPHLATAMRLIRSRACDPLRVSALVAEIPLSRRTLETRFKAAFGRTIHDEIRRVQLERAKDMLRNTDWTIPVVAENIGLSDDRMFSRIFRTTFGISPGRYRSANRARS